MYNSYQVIAPEQPEFDEGDGPGDFTHAGCSDGECGEC